MAAREVANLVPGGSVEVDADDLAFPEPFSKAPPGEYRLRAILDPELVDQQAKADQARIAERYGGFDMLRRREKMAFTPPPTAGAH